MNENEMMILTLKGMLTEMSQDQQYKIKTAMSEMKEILAKYDETTNAFVLSFLSFEVSKGA